MLLSAADKSQTWTRPVSDHVAANLWSPTVVAYVKINIIISDYSNKTGWRALNGGANSCGPPDRIQCFAHCDLELWPFDTKTISLVEYPKVIIPYTKFEDFGIIRFWVMLRTDRQNHTDRQTRMSALLPWLSLALVMYNSFLLSSSEHTLATGPRVLSCCILVRCKLIYIKAVMGNIKALLRLKAVFSLSWSCPYCLGLVPRDQDSSRHLLKSASNLHNHQKPSWQSTWHWWLIFRTLTQINSEPFISSSHNSTVCGHSSRGYHHGVCLLLLHW